MPSHHYQPWDATKEVCSRQPPKDKMMHVQEMINLESEKE
jgi:hypothetical protein